jgi:fructose-1,6-bisphosphatase II / sedoheptulose-1,7-bisphosphatase
MGEVTFSDRNLALEAVRVTEAAALAASLHLGRGDEMEAGEAAAKAMHNALGSLAIDGTVRIGEGAKGETDILFVGESVGGGGLKVDIAAKPLEGHTIVAKGEANGLSAIAVTEDGGFLNTPDIYMDKIAVGPAFPNDLVDLDETPAKNLKALAKAKKAAVSDLVVCVLDRPRHRELVANIRDAGARIMLITDGDISGVIATTQKRTGVDIYMGIGGAPHGVLSAAALSCVGAQMQGRLVFRDNEERAKAQSMGITDQNHKYTANEMAAGDITFAATGVTTGTILGGVWRRRNVAVSHSMVIRSRTGTLRWVEAHHRIGKQKKG